MRRWLLIASTLPLCLLMSCGMIPKRGPERSDDQLLSADAHQWTDADARTALWFTRNFPDDLAALGFSLYKLPTYNQHDHRYGRRWSATSAGLAGYQRGVFLKETPDDFFAMIDDPQLRVKMLSLEARERNRMRERDRRRHEGTWPYDAASAPGERAPSRMDDAEVEQRLMEQYR